MTNPALKLSVTMLDNFRRYQSFDWMTHNEFIACLCREEFESTEIMEAGSALHTLLENSLPAGCGVASGRLSIEHAEQDGFRFDFSQLEGDVTLQLYPCRELTCEREYDVGGFAVQLRGRVDDFNGTVVRDHKLKTKSLSNLDSYTDSYQWRSYLSILDARLFQYNIFIGSMIKQNPHDWRIREVFQFPLSWYPELEQDVTGALTELVSFIRERISKNELSLALNGRLSRVANRNASRA